MTALEQIEEWDVEYETRLGMMCGDGDPTSEQIAIASKIAGEHIEACVKAS